MGNEESSCMRKREERDEVIERELPIRFREEEQCSNTPNPLLPKGCEKQVGVPSKTLQQWHVQSDLNGSVCAERLSAADATNMSSASTASTARSHGSKGEKWREMAVGSAGVEITNLFVSPGKSDFWNASLQKSIFTHTNNHKAKYPPEYVVDRKYVVPEDYKENRRGLDSYW
eukprot:CAMPEP_0179427660 /NCGR_PEP_ID=MMETSP0799-20121207/13536_1 /TAXON_ID=46947 /ORGANISM="Geminigera cryophila, Strain CCMP2564" /LENGTH=172 /DNA_ID=CAMNT_0021202785 /DNA_START=923 /DNA_END=1438 /DNA_ORIENTATION=+